MRWHTCFGIILVAVLSSNLTAQEKKKADTFTSAAEAGADFAIQGEYEGMLDGQGKAGAQVVALGKGAFDVYFLAGGLPGAGWDAKTRVKITAATVEGKVTVTGDGYKGVIEDGKLTGTNKDGQAFTLKHLVRQSPSVGAQPPKDAVILFNGTTADEWRGGKIVEDNLLFCGTSSKQAFATGKLHVEFRTPFMPKARGQGRGNSGVFIRGREIQVLDSFGLEGKKNECGAFYNFAKPAVNMCLPPLSWQTYDVEVKAGEGKDVVATVWHNSVLVHENFPINGAPASINLQNHGNPVVYRNIWFVAGDKK